jgi:hypothetical protein
VSDLNRRLSVAGIQGAPREASPTNNHRRDMASSGCSTRRDHRRSGESRIVGVVLVGLGLAIRRARLPGGTFDPLKVAESDEQGTAQGAGTRSITNFGIAISFAQFEET